MSLIALWKSKESYQSTKSKFENVGSEKHFFMAALVSEKQWVDFFWQPTWNCDLVDLND
jgi:hypothetical protein